MTSTVATERRQPAPGAGITSIATRVRDRAAETPDVVAMREKLFGVWQEVTWAQYWTNVLDAAHGLLALGVEPGDHVAIQSENRQEWLYTDLATVAVRAATTGLYPTNPTAEVAYLLADSRAKVIVSEDQEQVDKVLSAIDDLPDLERIIYVEPRGIRNRYDHPALMSWDELIEIGREHAAAHPHAVADRMAAARSDDVATLIYTSGTTGPPKGAMLTIANIEFAVQTLVEGGGFTSPPPSPARSDPVVPAAVPCR